MLLLSADAAYANVDCLRPAGFKSYTVPDNQTLIVRQGPNDRYKITLAMKCQSLEFAPAVGIKQFTSDMCVRPGDLVVYTHGGIEQRCIVSKIEPYAPPPKEETPDASGG
jgi:hypothetical protein